MTEEHGVVIIGAGPTGLGAACRLQQHGYNDWTLLEMAPEAGGLACSAVTPEGFTYDMGGHVIFSHYDYFDELIDSAVGRGDDYWNVHQRTCYVRLMDKMVPYPFQNNISSLPILTQMNCIRGIFSQRLFGLTFSTKPKTFDEWIVDNMGTQIADIFMRPYNFKVWATPTTNMQCKWLGERVSKVNAWRMARNFLYQRCEIGWGPNATFRFPKHGGTGSIWKSVASKLPRSKMQYNCTVSKFDLDSNELLMSDGRTIRYKKLISTVPLDCLLNSIGKDQLANRLTYSSSHIIGIGLRGKPHNDATSWMYFPENDSPFYRTTFFSKYAESNVPSSKTSLQTIRTGGSSQALNGAGSSPKKGPYWSLMLEVSESDTKPVNNNTLVEECVKGAVSTELIRPDDEIVSLWHRKLEHGYPVPTLDRDNVLDEVLPFLKSKDVYSRGRFGAYKYEAGNQDHSVMQGVEAVDNILLGTAESTLFNTDWVNQGHARKLVHHR